jgi:hypothetical protein
MKFLCNMLFQLDVSDTQINACKSNQNSFFYFIEMDIKQELYCSLNTNYVNKYFVKN